MTRRGDGIVGAAKALACLWAGLAIGGTLLAAPAKFQAPSLDLATALEVGRAQFHWVGLAEAAVCLLLLALLALSGRARWPAAAAPAVLFALQRLAVMPLLDARALQIIAGAAVPPSPAHLVYVGLEIAKVAALLALGFGALAIARGPAAAIRPASRTETAS